MLPAGSMLLLALLNYFVGGAGIRLYKPCEDIRCLVSSSETVLEFSKGGPIAEPSLGRSFARSSASSLQWTSVSEMLVCDKVHLS